MWRCMTFGCACATSCLQSGPAQIMQRPPGIWPSSIFLGKPSPLVVWLRPGAQVQTHGFHLLATPLACLLCSSCMRPHASSAESEREQPALRYIQKERIPRREHCVQWPIPQWSGRGIMETSRASMSTCAKEVASGLHQSAAAFYRVANPICSVRPNDLPAFVL
jgi:hypothetical protein